MALETLKEVKEVNGYPVIVMDELREKYPEKFIKSGQMDWKWFESEIRPNNFIYLRHDKNSISFTIQDGAVKENGVNGCQVDEIIKVAKLIIDGLNKNFPCDHNYSASYHLNEALEHLRLRKEDREKRGVEGYNKE